MTQKPELHGRDHRLGGADPIYTEGAAPWVSATNAPFCAQFGQILQYTVGELPAFDITAPYTWTFDSFDYSNYVSDGHTMTTGDSSSVNENDYFNIDPVDHPTRSYVIKQPGFYYIWGSINIEPDFDHDFATFDPFWTGMLMIAASTGSWVPLGSTHEGWQYMPTDKLGGSGSHIQTYRHEINNLIYVPTGPISHSMSLEVTGTEILTTDGINKFAYVGAVRLAGPTG